MNEASEAVTALVRKARRFKPTVADPRPEPPPEDAPPANAGPHPLVRFVDLTGPIKAPRWVVPGVIAEGVFVIAGQQGIGKTTGMVPLSMLPAGLHGPDDPLAPDPGRWRHVVYVTEDVDQVQRIVGGIVAFGRLGVEWTRIEERFHVVPAARLAVETIVQVADEYRARFARMVDGVELMPLVVIDTKSAVIAADDENDNASASAIVAALKQRFHGCPLWIVTHVSKQNIGRADVAGLTSRGASALDADAHGTAFLVQEGDERYLVLGKRRYEPRWTELRLTPRWQQTTATNAWGEAESATIRWSVPEPAQETRSAARQRAQEGAREEETTQLRGEVLDAVEVAWSGGIPLNRAGVKSKVRRKSAEVGAAIDALLSECWLVEVPVPKSLRTHPARAAFLVRLADVERIAVLKGRPLPEGKASIPPAWRRATEETPPVPAGNGSEPEER